MQTYCLQQTSRDLIPAWKFTGTRAVKSTEGDCLHFYMQRPEYDLFFFYRHASEWMKTCMCRDPSLDILGPPWGGKSEFGNWLAPEKNRT